MVLFRRVFFWAVSNRRNHLDFAFKTRCQTSAGRLTGQNGSQTKSDPADRRVGRSALSRSAWSQVEWRRGWLTCRRFMRLAAHFHG